MSHILFICRIGIVLPTKKSSSLRRFSSSAASLAGQNGTGLSRDRLIVSISDCRADDSAPNFQHAHSRDVLMSDLESLLLYPSRPAAAAAACTRPNLATQLLNGYDSNGCCCPSIFFHCQLNHESRCQGQYAVKLDQVHLNSHYIDISSAQMQMQMLHRQSFEASCTT